ncbi:MAG: glycosyltransferase family 4 protein [Saprospiraceae bacterium]
MGHRPPPALMEILFVSHKYPPSIGGMEKQSFELIRGMERHAKVHAIVYEGQGGILRFFLGLRRRILQCCRENPGISIIHFNDGLLAAICLRHKGYEHLKRTATLHGLEVVFPNRLYQQYILPKFNRLDLIFAVSQATAQACTERGLAPEKVVVVPNGVDADIAATRLRPDFYEFFREKYGPDLAGKRLLVTMGRSVKRKGFSWFIENVLPRLPENCQLLMIGPFQAKPQGLALWLPFFPGFLRRQIELFLGFPTDETRLRELLAQPDLQARVRHLGKLPFADITQILAAADAFVMPNRPIPGDMEGFGLVCLEASLCGATVLAAHTDGIPDAIHDGKNGWLLPAQNAEAWADAIRSLLDNPDRKEQAAAFRQYTLATFSWEKMAEEYSAHFQALIKNQG